jgi:hypothetical protein
VFGGDIPTEIWTQYMREALAGLPAAAFPAPASLGHGTNEPGAPSPSPSATPGKQPGSTGKKPTTTTQHTPTTKPACHGHKCR